MIRLFTALKIPDDVKEELLGLKESIPGAKWVKKNNIHLTLQFIGEISEEKYHNLKDELEDVQMSTFELSLGKIDRFGEKVIYASVDHSVDLMDLQQMVKEKIESIVSVEKKKFIPHVTLARLNEVSVHDLAAYLQSNHDYESREFSVQSFCLYSSKLTKDGPIYALEGEYELF
ncbi:MAG: RNA 2',3'-cyclic phosphodiesterase [Deltaproteobacteria bacterium]|nr:MAG: RNA 2',3'-cyclic phosphodiesterase [Deltaproteobacteria bacterium]